VPYASGDRSGDEWVFSWPRGAGLQAQNAFGAMVAGSASCAVNAHTGWVAWASLDGKTLK
jgi:hypothetical protein